MSPHKSGLRFVRNSRRPQHAASRRSRVETLETRSLLAAAPFVPGEVLVAFEGDVAAQFRLEGPGKALQSAAARYAAFGLAQGQALTHHGGGATEQDRLITLWHLPPGKDVEDVAAQLSQVPGVAYAEPNYLVSTDATQLFPNDPKFTSLRGMHNTGQSGGTADSDIDAPEAWGLYAGTGSSVGSGNVVVAVIDTGVNYNHADLKANIWTNPLECPGGYGTCAANGADEDGNGYADDFYGYDFANNDADPKDDNGHGTHVSGTIGATGNNGTGVVGVNWDVQIMGLKFLDSGGSGTTANAVLAVEYATQMSEAGINVVLTSNSWGGGAYSQALYDAIEASGDAGMLFVAAAGNNYATSASYPALYDLDNIISVAATDRNDQLASFSNRGIGVDIAAPGVDVYSTYNNTYKTLSGTSMATPHVSGAAALVADYLKSETGSLPSYQDLRDAILNSGDQIPATLTTVSSGSRLNAYGAMLHAEVLAGRATGLSIADASIVEGNDGENPVVMLTVTRSGWLDTTTTVDWATADGAAAAPGDYTAVGSAASGDLVFLPGDTQLQIPVTIAGDSLMESHETFTVTLTGATNDPGGIGISLLRGAANVTILTDDVSVAISDATATEGDTRVGFKGEFISLGTGGDFTPYSMIYGPDGNLYASDIAGDRILRYDPTGTPLPAEGKTGADFVSVRSGGLDSPRQITFGPDGDLYVVSELTDSILRFDGITGDYMGVFVPSGSGGLSRPRGLLFHTDGNVYVTSVGPDETPAVGRDAILRYNAATAAPAGLSGTPGDAVFVPSNSGGLDNPSEIVFHEGHFYVSSTSQTPDAVLRYDASGLPAPAPGRTDALFVPPGPELDGPTEMVFRPDGLYVGSWRSDSVIRYDATTGNLIEVAVPPGVGGIDNTTAILFEPQGTFLVRGSNSRILRYGPASVAVFTVSLNTAAGVPVTVNYATADGTAIGDSGSTLGDYQPVSGAITFAPGETSKTILVVTRDDAESEGAETFFVNVDSVDAVVLDGQSVGTMIDNDLPSGGVEVINYASADVPKKIPDLATVTSKIVVTDASTVLDLDVRLDINHTYDWDLIVSLIAPDGTRVLLFGYVGGSGKNFKGTILDDEATTPINSGTAPFSGRFRPQGALADFDGKSAAGNWTLEITDHFTVNKGTLNSWSLDFTREAGASSTAAAAAAQLTEGGDGPSLGQSGSARSAAPSASAPPHNSPAAQPAPQFTEPARPAWATPQSIDAAVTDLFNPDASPAKRPIHKLPMIEPLLDVLAASLT